MLKQKFRYKPSRDDTSWLIFGDVIRSDEDAEFHVYDVIDPKNPNRVVREFVSDRRTVQIHRLEAGKEYIVAAFGNKVAGVATSHGTKVVAPFRCNLDASTDGSKDWMKLSIPTNKPVLPDLARAIKASLR